MSWKSCGNCMKNRMNRMVGEYLACSKTQEYWCNHLPHEKAFWKPIPCPFCRGPLSEVREHNGKKYRHCYACHFEFEEVQ